MLLFLWLAGESRPGGQPDQGLYWLNSTIFFKYWALCSLMVSEMAWLFPLDTQSPCSAFIFFHSGWLSPSWIRSYPILISISICFFSWSLHPFAWSLHPFAWSFYPFSWSICPCLREAQWGTRDFINEDNRL